MKIWKPFLIPVSCLILLDQLVKLLISSSYFEMDFDIIPAILRFRPIQNRNLSYAGNVIPFFSNQWAAMIINILALFLFVSGYLFYIRKKGRPGKAANTIMIFGLAGCICSFIDKAFWGGSLDFLQIPRLFTFDFKDCFLTVMEITAIIHIGIIHNKEINVKEYLQFCLHRAPP